jgi:hypothetical protein
MISFESQPLSHLEASLPHTSSILSINSICLGPTSPQHGYDSYSCTQIDWMCVCHERFDSRLIVRMNFIGFLLTFLFTAATTRSHIEDIFVSVAIFEYKITRRLVVSALGQNRRVPALPVRFSATRASSSSRKAIPPDNFVAFLPLEFRHVPLFRMTYIFCGVEGTELSLFADRRLIFS